MGTMKTKLIWLLTTFVWLSMISTSAKTSGIRIEIALSDITDTIMVYPMNNVEQQWDPPFKTLPVKGVATFNIPLNEVTNLFIYGKRQSKDTLMTIMPLNIRIVGIPGGELIISGTSIDYHISGSPFYKIYGEAVANTLFRKDYQQMIRTYGTMQKNGITQDSLKSYIKQTQKEITQKKNTAIMSYIRTNPTSEAAILLLNELDIDTFFKVDPLLTQAVKEGRLKSIYLSVKESYEKRKQKEETSKRLTKGAPAPDFTLDDLSGQPFSLKSLRGKYAILDFWGSWCGWCIKGFPDMKKYYDKYKEKMEIVGVDCGDTETRWKEAVSKHALPWLQVRNTEQTAVDVKYAISGYPTKVIIDPEGRIDRIFVGEDPKFYEYIDQMMAH
ncbi:thiol-disulfide oxidoreductase [Prevotella sp. oral taxon 820]|nr:thiol-disulfide oxidoreductase [Prevotella sp. oral taxon 820]